MSIMERMLSRSGRCVKAAARLLHATQVTEPALQREIEAMAARLEMLVEEIEVHADEQDALDLLSRYGPR